MGSSRKYLVVVNPASGRVSKHKIVPEIYRRLSKVGLDFDIVFTSGKGHARTLAENAAKEGYYGVIACGGDGTVNEIATGLIGTETALGIIPTGSGNGLARHLGIPVDIASSIKVIVADDVLSVDYGTANDEPFFCTFGVGFDAAVSERCARERRRGVIMYLKNTIEEYVKFSPEEYIIEVNGKVLTEKALLVVCCNASQYGNNAFIAPQASITDGELDLTIVHTGTLFTQALVGVDLLTGFIGRNALIDTIRTDSAVIRRKKAGAAHLDGDAVIMSEEISVKCCPGRLKVFCASKETQFKPFITPTKLLLRDCGIWMKSLFVKD